ncbi:MAG: DEAD/DEAH box helicase [Bdellovibrionaceae bacterium]|nr:DEAD/DEAH box helicase [Pseudobdellovibrionaceae bacterium]
MNEFGQLALPEQLQNALVKLEFKTPTPIQAQAIPVALEGRDIIGCAQTGTGKTAAFAIPLIAKLAVDHGKDALILAPTRELAQQITEVLRQLVETLPRLRPALIMGGASMRIQHQVMRRHPRIIVATPGRMIDHLGSKTISLSRIGFLVLDEADQMLDMGFAPQLNQILKYLPQERQTMLFSATLPDKILELAGRFLKNPARITVGAPSRPIEKITQTVLHTTAAKKNDLLLDQLNARTGSALIFVRTKSRTEKLFQYLEEYGYDVARIHGGRSQSQRTQALNGFRNGKTRVLVATDIAARGLDVPHIEHVINFDLPMAPEDYVHRIGRTARAGRVGEALAFLLPEDESQWRRILRLIDPNAKKEKTYSRPPIGANSRRRDDSRHDSRDERPYERTNGRSFGRSQERDSRDSRPQERDSRDSRPQGRPHSKPQAGPPSRSQTRNPSRPQASRPSRPEFGPRAGSSSRPAPDSDRFDRSQYPQRPFSKTERDSNSQDRWERGEPQARRASFNRGDSRPSRTERGPKSAGPMSSSRGPRPARASDNHRGGGHGFPKRKAFGGPSQRDGDHRRAGPRPGRKPFGSKPGFARA